MSYERRYLIGPVEEMAVELDIYMLYNYKGEE